MKSLISSLKGDAAELISQNAGMKKILRDLGKGTTYGIISRIAEFFHPLQSAKSLLAITNGKIFHMETLYIKTKYYKNVWGELWILNAIKIFKWDYICRKLGPYEHLHSMLQNKMATSKLGFDIYALTTIPERADVGDGSGGKRGTSETPDLPVTVSKLMTCERKHAFEPCYMLFASLIRGLLCINRCRRHFILYHGVEMFKISNLSNSN